MTVTVKLEAEKKRSLEKFLATLMVQEGIKVTLQEALGLMVDYSLENRNDFARRLKSLPPLEEDTAWKMLEEPDDWGVSDSSEKHDPGPGPAESRIRQPQPSEASRSKVLNQRVRVFDKPKHRVSS